MYTCSWDGIVQIVDKEVQTDAIDGAVATSAIVAQAEFPEKEFAATRYGIDVEVETDTSSCTPTELQHSLPPTLDDIKQFVSMTVSHWHSSASSPSTPKRRRAR